MNIQPAPLGLGRPTDPAAFAVVDAAKGEIVSIHLDNFRAEEQASLRHARTMGDYLVQPLFLA